MPLCYDHRGPNRLPPTWRQILNPIWLMSDTERNMAWPWWRWFLRNPFCNFYQVVIGIAHKPRMCAWLRSPWTFAEKGWNLGYIQADGSWLKLPFISHRGTCVEWCAGWMTAGGFAMTIRRANSPNATETP